MLQSLKDDKREDGDGFFSVATGDRIRSNSLKFQQKKLRLPMRRDFLTMRVVQWCNRLPRAPVVSPSMEVFKSRLDRCLVGVVESGMTLP